MPGCPVITGAVEAIEESPTLVGLADVLRAGLMHVELPLDLVDSAQKRQRLAAEWQKLGAAAAGDTQDARRRVVSIRAIRSTLETAAPSADPLERAGVAIEIARELGAEMVIVDAGYPDDDDQRRERLEKLAQLGDQAATANVTLALATAPGLCGDTRSMARTLSDVAHPAARLEFDTGAYVALNPYSSVEVALQRIIAHVACVRLRDHQGFDGDDGFRPLGLGGVVEFARMLQILQTVAFGGPAIVELPPPSRRDRKQPRSKQLIDSVAHLRQCGWFDGAAG